MSNKAKCKRLLLLKPSMRRKQQFGASETVNSGRRMKHVDLHVDLSGILASRIVSRIRWT